MATSLWASDFKRCLSAKASKASQQQLRTLWLTNPRYAWRTTSSHYLRGWLEQQHWHPHSG
jgi:hypothetical protein